MFPTHQSRLKVFVVGLLILIVGSIMSHAAPPIRVETADPPEAEQETVGLDVTVTGRGFPSSSSNAHVEFLVTTTTNNGGVTVKNISIVNSKKLIATIDVAESATVASFDIEVIELSSGRKGKGIGMFRVIEKIHPNCGDSVCQGNEELTCPEDCAPAEPDPELLATIAGVEVDSGGYFAQYGLCVADLNGDGSPELVVGDPGFDGGGQETDNPGKVSVFSVELEADTKKILLTPDLRYSVTGETNDSQLGYWVASAGDFNNDTYEDIVVGAPYFSRGKRRRDKRVGKVYVFGGGPEGFQPDPLFEREGEVGSAWLGRTVAGAGDFDGDGCDDIVIGAAQSPGGPGGAFYVIPGCSGSTSPAPIFTCENAGVGNFAISVAGGLQVESCANDAVVAGGYYDGYLDHVFAYCGDDPNYTDCWDHPDSIIFDAVSDPPPSPGVFGHRVAVVGNFDGDIMENFEIAISNIVPDDSGDNFGWVYICDARKIGGNPGNCAPGGGRLVRVEGERIGDRWGSGLAGGYLDNDGFTDVVAGGSVDYAGDGDLTTMVKVIFGGTWDAVTNPYPPLGPPGKSFVRRSLPNTQFGRVVSVFPDFNRVGFDYILVGAHRDLDDGMVYLYSVEASCGDGICGEDEQVHDSSGALYCPEDCGTSP